MGKLYVAYGSNLNKQQMKGRCPESVFLGTGIIEGYELQFKGSVYGAHATIAPKEGSSVPVGVWTIQKRDEKRLDLYEGHNPKGYSYYDKKYLPVQMDDGSTCSGMIYIMNQKHDFGQPSQGYYDTVWRGYEDCGLDTRVLEQALRESVQQAQHRMTQEPAAPW